MNIQVNVHCLSSCAEVPTAHRDTLFFWIIDTAILNAYLIGRQLHGNNYMKHKEFRANLWTSLFSYSAQVSFERKLPKFYPPTTTPIPYTFQTKSLINIESHPSTNQQVEIVEHKWKILGK